jgi:hypothetical protein
MADFFRTPELRPMMTRMIGRGIATGFDDVDVDVDPTNEEIPILNDMMHRQRAPSLSDMASGSWLCSMRKSPPPRPRIVACVQLRSLIEICVAMGTDCPAASRK